MTIEEIKEFIWEEIKEKDKRLGITAPHGENAVRFIEEELAVSIKEVGDKFDWNPIKLAREIWNYQEINKMETSCVHDWEVLPSKKRCKKCGRNEKGE